MIIDDDMIEENDTAQSDLVRMALNLAYMTETEARNFNFNVASAMNQKDHTRGYQGTNQMQ